MALNNYLKNITSLVVWLFIGKTATAAPQEVKPFTLKLNGSVEFQSAFINNNGNAGQKYVTKNHKNMGFDSRSHIDLEITDIVKNIFEFGGKIGLETTGRNDRRVASHLFALSDYGKIELGSDKSAYAKMKITGSSVAVGPGGAWDTYTNLASDPRKLAYVTNFGNFLDAKTRTPERVEYSRKISYYTPKIQGVQFGISYVPDSSNNGHDAHDGDYKTKIAKPLQTEFAIKDGVACSVSYEYKNELFSIRSAIGSENGKIKAVSNVPKNTKFSNLRTYNIGSEIIYQQYGLAASYSNYMKSLTSSDVDLLGRTTYLYSASARYKLDKFACSFTYFFSNHKKSKINAITLATEYKIIKGLLAYAEATHYQANGKFTENNLPKIDKLKGNILILGGKLVF